MEELVLVRRTRERVRTLLERYEVRGRTVGVVGHEDREIRETAHEDRVAGAQQVGWSLGQLHDRDHERRRSFAPVRPKAFRVREVDHDLDVRPGTVALVVALVGHDAPQTFDEPVETCARRRSVPCEGALDDRVTRRKAYRGGWGRRHRAPGGGEGRFRVGLPLSGRGYACTPTAAIRPRPCASTFQDPPSSADTYTVPSASPNATMERTPARRPASRHPVSTLPASHSGSPSRQRSNRPPSSGRRYSADFPPNGPSDALSTTQERGNATARR